MLNKCPKCGGEDIRFIARSESYGVDGKLVSIRKFCNSCKFEWVDYGKNREHTIEEIKEKEL